MREAANVQYLSAIDADQKKAAAQRFLGLTDTTLPEWKDLKKDIEGRRGSRLP